MNLNGEIIELTKIQASKANQGTFQSTGKITAEDYDELNQKVLEFIQKLKEESKITNYNQIVFLFRSVKMIRL